MDHLFRGKWTIECVNNCFDMKHLSISSTSSFSKCDSITQCVCVCVCMQVCLTTYVCLCVLYTWRCVCACVCEVKGTIHLPISFQQRITVWLILHLLCLMIVLDHDEWHYLSFLRITGASVTEREQVSFLTLTTLGD